MSATAARCLLAPRSRVAVAVSFAAQGGLFAVLLTHLPAFQDRVGLGDGAVTLVVLGVTVLAGAGSVLAGVVAARSGSAVVLRAGLAVECLAVLVLAAVPGRVAFGAGFAAYGLALGAVDAAGNTQAVLAERRAGRSILTSFHASWSAAGIAGALGTTLSERLGAPFAVALGLPAGIVAVAVAVTAPAYLRGAGPEVQQADPGDRSVPWRPVLAVGSAMALFYVADSGISSWSTVYLHEDLGAGAGAAALGYAAYQATALASRVAGDHAVRRVAAAPVVRAGAVLGLLGLALLVTATRPWMAVTGCAVVGLGLPVVAPLCFAACGRLVPGAVDVVVARVNLFNYAGALGGAVGVGLVGTAVSLRVGFVLPLVLTAALLVLAPAFGRGPAAAVPQRVAEQL